MTFVCHVAAAMSCQGPSGMSLGSIGWAGGEALCLVQIVH